MTQAMIEVLPIARVRDDLDGKLMDISPLAVGLQGGGTGLVREPDDIVHPPLFLARLPHTDRTRHIGVVVQVTRPVVHDDHVALLDDVAAGTGMGVGAVGTRCDDGLEREGVSPVCKHEALELSPQLLLGETRPYESTDVLEGEVGNGLCPPHEPDLALALDDAQPHDVRVQTRQEAGYAAS